ncbi:glycogen debranching enzyme-like isoform X1 [Biomphalaria glabrata]|uniref:Glycogen debranching enzyme n=1 Tax=Biomphalaria glabrata TaxID=6526 RepID=A0A9W3AIC8_BIOGL|nr:glycogen debranching enzyme-like isoform X1 [Biomphalaria glabrata]
MSSLPQIRVLTLNQDENNQYKLYRLEKGWILRFVLGPSLMASNVRLFCNHPDNLNSSYDRKKFYEIHWKTVTGIKSDRTDMIADVKIIIPGSFNYFFTIDNSVKQESSNGSGYFLVDPTLTAGDEEINMDAIVCQSVITKLLGPFKDWIPRLQVAYESGYNMVHFTPVQELGISNSAYSIRDQLKFSPVYSKGDTKQHDYSDLEKLVDYMNKNWKVMSLSDLVYNHTAKDSPWLWQHPECAFNLQNSPHLRPAYVVDRILEHFSLEVSKGLWEKDGIPAQVNSEYHLSAIGHALHHKVFPQYRLHEFFCLGVDNIIKEFKKAIENSPSPDDYTGNELHIIQDPNYHRFKSTIDMNLALKLFNTDSPRVNFGPGVFSRADRIAKCCEALTEHLIVLNANKEREVQDHIKCAIGNFIANAKWRFVNPAGPKISQVTEKEPLMHGYFIIPKAHEGSVEKEEKLSYEEPSHIMACNGWVMGDDPLRNFAEPGGRQVYLRRELVGWGDSVKLNYGKEPRDCPYLWQRMEDYTKISAKIFQGLRLDNCHSTPIHVAEHMLDVARKVRPNLYVIAELFTGSEHLDNLFMNRLGINSLIREALVAHDSHDQGRLVHRFGGDPVGAFIQPRIKPLVPCVAHALFYDQTHDNECPIEKRSAWDLWPTGAMVAISNCAIGSNRGYDQMVPIHINVVTEERLYTSWSTHPSPEPPFINGTFGITAGKKALNRLHYWLARQGYSQVYVDQVDYNTVSITRHKPQSHESVVLIARTSFSHPGNPLEQGYIKNISVQGMVDEIILEGRLHKSSQFEYKRNSDYINGLPDYYLQLREHFPVHESQVIRTRSLDDGQATEISFFNMTPGSVVAIKCSLPEVARGAILEIRRGLGHFGYMLRSYSGNTMFSDAEDSSFRGIVSKLNFADLNRCLYRIDQEERDDCYGFGAYNVPNSGNLVYCGIKGVMSLLSVIRPTNDLGHPLCCNLRDGNWLPDYLANRLKVHSGLENLAKWFQSIFKHLEKMPRYLIPCYFDAILTGADIVLSEAAKDLMSDFVRDGSNFVKMLSLTAYQLVGYTCQARLPFLSPKLVPRPRQEFNNKTKQLEEAALSMSAGFPHFGGGYMRNWGRDTFISLRGLLLVTGQYELARHIILGYAGTLRHGLIPNLLNEGTGARFNARDAVWYWLIAIRDFCQQVKDGYNILKDPVSRLFPTDDSPSLRPGEHDQPLYEVMQEALNRHAQGVSFRERNAGVQIDDQMTDLGFNVQVGIDWSTGFVFGGNEHNCGTWMDKMGSSAKAGNKGKPATPRDGSAVELVGMCAGVVQWLASANEKKLYPYDGVECLQNGKKEKVTYKAWFEKIKANFEKCYFIAEKADPNNEPRPDLINRRGIYKDTLNASFCWTDYQLRCNFPVAMMACPDLFTTEKAWKALTMAEKILMGPLGMKTLDPSDYSYRGDYFNDNDTTDMYVANGWNYHQGPEWVWPVGFFLRAKLHFAHKLESKNPGILNQTKLYINSVLCKHYEEILSNPWRGLPELTNSNGQYCPGSCRTQAWSSATILETLHDMAKLEE